MSLEGMGRSAVRQGRRQAEKAVEEAKPWVVALARFGFVAKGVVYLVIGLLALQAAIGLGGKAADSKDALKTILGQPFGQGLLGALAVGLFGYALWRFVQAILDPERKGADARGILKRTGYFLSGIAYGGLALTAAQLVVGMARGKEKSIQDWTAELMAQPLGAWLVGATGLIVIGLAINSFYLACSARFRKKLKLNEMSPAAERWAVHMGRSGLAARGVVLALIGVFLLQAAVTTNAKEAQGLSGALATLVRQPYGPWLLAAVAVGFVAYGLYMFVEGKYRRVYL